MDQNRSPWIAELDAARKSHTPNLKTEYDVSIVGGGIAGMMTAYYALKNTNHSVILVEADRLGHGASGHNGGQMVDYFEKPFSEIVTEYGLPMAIAGQKAVTSAFDLIEEVFQETKIEIPFARVTGYAGCTTLEQLLNHLENKYLKHSGGLQVEHAMLAEGLIKPADIPEKYAELYEWVPQQTILDHLETKNPIYIALLKSRKGTMNSALFVEKLADYLLLTYADRFTIREHAPVFEVNLYPKEVILETNQSKIKSKYAVLCTNGFEGMHITNEGGLDVNHMFHQNISGVIGYMAGYLETAEKPPKAVSYFPPSATGSSDDTYFYVTRRNHMWEEIQRSLVTIGGGSEDFHEELAKYSKHMPYSAAAFKELDTFLTQTYEENKNGVDYVFKWHGLMGYTKSGIRSVGAEPANGRLLYNLGCNGVGLLPSIYGGKKISEHLTGEPPEMTIFDPIIQKMAVLMRQ
ncbi:MAG: NAD(P)/FAD-dependent oxidoreductase [Weeksellaceae bacterium]